MKKLANEFKKFISRGNVVDMAVGVAVASAFTKIVTAFTNGFIGPILALISGDANLVDFKWVVREAVTHVDETGAEVVDVAEVAILWGSFLQTILDFLIIAFVLFMVMKVFNKAIEMSKEVREDIKDELKPKKLKKEEAARLAAEKEAKEKAEAEEKARLEAEEAAAKEKAEAQLAAYKAQVAISENTQALLTEIRDLLKNK